MPRFQYYGIKFPITLQSEDKTLFDLSYNKAEMVKSELLHLLFTRSETRLRQPYFGTSLLQFLFNPSDGQTYDGIKREIKDKVSRWIPDCTLNDISITESEDGLSILVTIYYSVKEDDGSTSNYEYTTVI